MLTPQFINPIIDSIFQAQKEKHLLMPDAFALAHPASEYLAYKEGRTTNPYFEKLKNPHLTYRLKPKTSAATALESLLTTGETFIECGVGLAIFYNLVVLRKMEEKWGKEAGRQRFDRLFGSKSDITPEQRRLIISPFSIIMGLQYSSELGVLPVQPLSYFVNFKDVGHKNNLAQHAKIGWQVMFMGDPNYNKKHAAGSYGAFNCVVISLNPLRVRIVETPGELTEDGLCALHMKEYDKTVSFESFSLLNQKFRNSQEFITLSKTPCNKDRIPGFYKEMIALDEEKFNFLINADLNEVIAKVNQHLHEIKLKCIHEVFYQATKPGMQEAAYSSAEHSVADDYLSGMKGGLQKAFTPSVTANPPAAPKAKTKEGSAQAYAGLEGLRGAFSKLSLEAPAQVAKSSSSTVSSKKDDAYAGLKGLRGAFSSGLKK